jgi:ribosomal protein S18 acetylase RimI-like enzyme
VRSIVPEDEQGLLDLWRETWTSTYGPSLGAEALQAMLQELDRGTSAMLARRGERCYALVDGRRIVGSAIVAERGEVAYLWGMYVRPAQQRSGAGSQLLAAVARDLDVATSLEARVLTTSRHAQAFYHARGFSVIGEETTDITGGVAVPASVVRIEVARLRATLG